ncbi:MAG TPA: glutamine synthetase beta-grasp domain-containing protein, partial [Ignavibacteria bacterium]|nr:glutamine synthetase beta-grasp domain-containing protein [Ignavibacteria bacterium]
MAKKNQIDAEKDKLKAINDVFKLAKEKEVKMVDLRFTDMPGQWQHFSIPIDKLEEASFYEGFGFDGSSIRGWKSINDSDMLVMPDPTTAHVDPFIKSTSLVMICDVV